MKKKVSLLLCAVALLASLFGGARPAYAWSCSALTSHSWFCSEGNSHWFVNYRDGAYTYIEL